MNCLNVHLPDAILPLVENQHLENYGLIACGEGERSGADYRIALNRLTVQDLFGEQPADGKMADCCLSGLWLLHGFLDESHTISQSVTSREGSFWHGIMHRLEGDFWNSKYWYRKIGTHPVIDELSVANEHYPEGFVDATESAFQNGHAERVAALATEEWARLFEYCFEQAR